MGTLYLFSVNVIKSSAIAGVLKNHGLNVENVGPNMYNLTLAEVTGMKRKTSKAGSKDPNMKEFENEMMVFCRIDSKMLDLLFDELRKAGIEPAKRRAVLTPANIGWTVTRLYKELDEHAKLMA